MTGNVMERDFKMKKILGGIIAVWIIYAVLVPKVAVAGNLEGDRRGIEVLCMASMTVAYDKLKDSSEYGERLLQAVIDIGASIFSYDNREELMTEAKDLATWINSTPETRKSISTIGEDGSKPVLVQCGELYDKGFFKTKDIQGEQI